MGSKRSLLFALGLLLLAALAGLGLGGLLADRTDVDEPQASGGGTPVASPSPTLDEPEEDVLTATASTTAARAGERLTLSGEMVGAGAGVALQVQRQEDGEWADFPAQTSTGADGSYSLDVELGRPGDNVLRVVAPSSGAESDPVTVTID